MVWKGCERSVITYSSLISACEKAGQWELALELFNEMHSEGCSPNTVTFNSLITACAQGERVAAAWCTSSSACAGLVARLYVAKLCQAARALPITGIFFGFSLMSHSLAGVQNKACASVPLHASRQAEASLCPGSHALIMHVRHTLSCTGGCWCGRDM